MIETERLLLREYTPEDFGALHEIMSDPETMRHYPAPFDEARTRRWIEWNLENYAGYGFGLWAVILKETGEFIGDCGITIQNIDGEMLPEIGYHIHKRYWRRGYAKEAARAVRDWAFQNTEYNVLYSYMKHTNEGSWRTAMANGMKKVKEYPDPKNTVSYAFAITREEWEKQNEMRRCQTMKQNPDVYLFGQVLGTHSFLLKDGFLRPDEYSEIREQYFLPGGETGTAATVLDSLGVSVRMDGTWIGTEVAPMLKAFYAEKNVDLSPLQFTDFPGVMDYVVIAGLVRSPMGRFQTLFASGERWWSIPKEEDIAGCRAAAVDPYFREESLLAAKYCRAHGVPYVTIDCPHDSPLHRGAAVNVVSKECTGEYYPGLAPEEIVEKLKEASDGLTILTQGGGEMLYGRKGEAIRRMKPFPVEVRSTLGAGDTFKAGCVYGLLNGMGDDELVRFASACSGIAISRFPLPLHPPRPEEVRKLMSD